MISKKDPIAVIGIGLNFPGADNPKDFWENLLSGKDFQVGFPTERFDSSKYQMPQKGYFLDNYPGFDPKIFGIKPNVARQMDPMQWLALDTAKAALDDAGITPEYLQNHECGVWCGVVSSDSYAEVALTPIEDYTPHTSFGCDQSMISGRLAYHLNLTGPTLTINSACSSSLNAVISGAQALLCGQCDISLVGGVHLHINPTSVIIRNKTGLLSPDSECRSYDQDSNGYALGEGCGFVILERLSQAKMLGHRVYGLVNGYAQGHSGSLLSLGQISNQAVEKIVNKALEDGNISINDVAFIEGHGAGTVNGDNAELTAFSNLTAGLEHCLYLSSVKSHIGHLEAAAGIAGFITAVLELNQRKIVPAGHFKKKRQVVGSNTENLIIPQHIVSLPDNEHYAIVSSYGLNGTISALTLAAYNEEIHCLNSIINQRHKTKYTVVKAREVLHRAEIVEAKNNIDWATVLQDIWREALCLDEDKEIDSNISFVELGGDSLDATYMINELCEKYKLPIEPTELLNYQTINSLTQFLKGLELTESIPNNPDKYTGNSDEPIAIIGAVGKFPGADDCIEYWHNLLGNVISYKTEEENFTEFPAEYFGFTAREAELLDPQQRIFLYQSWQLLKQTGYWQKETDIGVVAAAGPSTYIMKTIHEWHDVLAHYSNMEIMVANNIGSLAGRVSYKLNLCGPAFALDTHCSSSLVALDEACQLLNNHRCKMVIAGGVSFYADKVDGIIVSPTDECRPFSKMANGTIFKNGCGVVLLKQLSQAENDGDQILAVIKAARTNQDGSKKAGFCAPAGLAQEELCRNLLRDAGLEPGDISYIEAHGAGTVLGDKLELNAYQNVFGATNEHKIYIGCVKSNIGHCGQAAGMAGLMKALYICQTRTAPPANIKSPLNMLVSDHSPFIINEDEVKLNDNQEINILVSNIGFGGTNSQLIVGSYNKTPNVSDSLLFKKTEILPTKSYDLNLKKSETVLEKIQNQTSGVNKDEILQILKDASGLESINDETALSSLGLDSLVLTSLLSKLQKCFASSTGIDTIFASRTVGELFEKLENKKPRCILDEVIMVICREVFGEQVPGINRILPKPIAPLLEALEQLYSVSLDNLPDYEEATVASISNYISTQNSLVEIEEKSEQFLEAFNNE